MAAAPLNGGAGLTRGRPVLHLQVMQRWALVIALVAVAGCGADGPASPGGTGGASSGEGAGGDVGVGGAAGSASVTATGGAASTGGVTTADGTGGMHASTGGAMSTGGTMGQGGHGGSGPSATGGAAVTIYPSCTDYFTYAGGSGCSIPAQTPGFTISGYKDGHLCGECVGMLPGTPDCKASGGPNPGLCVQSCDECTYTGAPVSGS